MLAGCTLSGVVGRGPPRASKDKPYKVKVRVGPTQIVDRAYCGARTGDPLHC